LKTQRQAFLDVLEGEDAKGPMVKASFKAGELGNSEMGLGKSMVFGKPMLFGWHILHVFAGIWMIFGDKP